MYPNDPKSLITIDEDIKQAFRGTELPRDFIDVEKELLKMGMKPATRTAERRAAAQVLGAHLSKSKTKKKQTRKFTARKITNSHMPELFQSDDF
jgi:transcription initiation factor TFIIE subunit beta